MTKLQAPFPYFGGKSRVAGEVWSRFGDVRNYVEPFFGSGAVLLGRPEPFSGTETVNDGDGLMSNFWRAVQQAPEDVAEHADWPANENDLHARHSWLVGQKDSLQSRLEGDPDYFDPKIAGWWCWGLCCWIGSGWCSGEGPWQPIGGKLVKTGSKRGASRVQGVSRKRPHLGDLGIGVHRPAANIYEWMDTLASRIRRVRVCCGDWSRISGQATTTRIGLTGIFLDPPYSDKAGRRNPELYRAESLSVAHAVREWAIEHGEDPKLRIALCGYDSEHSMPDSWECLSWSPTGGPASTDARCQA